MTRVAFSAVDELEEAAQALGWRIEYRQMSSYIRPGIGIGSDRPLDWNLEIGFRVIF